MESARTSLGGTRAQHAAHLTGQVVDLGLQRARDLGAQGAELARPGAVAGQVHLGAQRARGVVNVLQDLGDLVARVRL